jgi:hypothetical protein
MSRPGGVACLGGPWRCLGVQFSWLAPSQSPASSRRTASAFSAGDTGRPAIIARAAAKSASAAPAAFGVQAGVQAFAGGVVSPVSKALRTDCRQVRDQEVAGSNPVTPTVFRNEPFGEQVEGLFLYLYGDTTVLYGDTTVLNGDTTGVAGVRVLIGCFEVSEVPLSRTAPGTPPRRHHLDSRPRRFPFPPTDRSTASEAGIVPPGRLA